MFRKPDETFDVAAAQGYLAEHGIGVSRSTIRRWAADDQLPGVRLVGGKAWLLTRTSLDDVIRRRRLRLPRTD